MKNFLKMTLATLAGIFLFGIIATFAMFYMLGVMVSFSETETVMPREGVLHINMSAMTLSEQSQEADPVATLTGKNSSPVTNPKLLLQGFTLCGPQFPQP